MSLGASPNAAIPLGSAELFSIFQLIVLVSQRTTLLFLSALTSTFFPAAAGGCFHPTGSDKPARQGLLSSKLPTGTVGGSLVNIGEHLAAKDTYTFLRTGGDQTRAKRRVNIGGL